MDQQHSSMLVPAAVLLLLVIFTPLSLQDDRDRTFNDCYGTENSTTTPSAFTTNLNTFLSNITSHLTPLNYYPTFYSASIGAPGPDAVFGFAQCISAGTAGDCRDCLRQSAPEILQLCPSSKKAFLLHTYCILRYSNESSSFYTPGLMNLLALWSSSNSTDPWSFNTKMMTLMWKLSSMAASSTSKMVLGFTKYDDYSSIYGMAQCTMDISSNDCLLCLMRVMGAVPRYCQTRKGCTMYAPSCSIRYENYVFTPAFNTSTDVLALPPQPPQAASNSSPPPLSGAVGVLPAAGPSKSNGSKNHKKIIVAVVGAITSLILLLAIGFTGIARKKRMKINGAAILEEIEDSKSLLFHLDVLKAATDDFSETNKLGQGGFGSVYKGTLSDGQEIAVKRLLGTSNQGMEELITEVALVAKLQHRNLVKLLGCCLKKQEKLLVYEYMPNNSLEKLLFDPIRKSELQWAQRYKIITGIAKGLLYLHEESRLKIIHRDLKASNILLDANLVPKISDFGLAKIVSTDQTQGNTGRIAGTYGYMAPEYAMNGNFSTKSDVFSFGVLILEIITGRKNSSFSKVEGAINLLGHTWKHWTEGISMRDLIDEKLKGDYQITEASRCIHIGLLCVQQDAVRRPNMSTVVLMLSSCTITLPMPSPPAFCAHYFPSIDIASFQSAGVRTGHISLYEASITELDPR